MKMHFMMTAPVKEKVRNAPATVTHAPSGIEVTARLQNHRGLLARLTPEAKSRLRAYYDEVTPVGDGDLVSCN
jgi:hypothetical protein